MLDIKEFSEYQVAGAKEVVYFNPYESNGGAVVAIAGEDFAVIGADTRLSLGYSIHTREQNKLFNLSKYSVLGSTGCWCDILSLTSLVRTRMQSYEHTHQRTMSTGAIAQMLSILMYNRRFFPYYVNNILAGIDEDGTGAVYSYDPIGHISRSNYRASGSSGTLLQPVLDSQVGRKNQSKADGETFLPISCERAVAIIKDTFISASERDIYTGDGVYINIITKDGIKEDRLALRKD